MPNASLYAATKGAIDAFTRSLAIELAADNVRVNVVSPGAIDTPIIQKLGIPPEQIAAVKAHQEQTLIPMHRYGRPEEVAHVILAQIEATYVTASIWHVDGGAGA
ncbi:MAG: SDR family oxidoreductase [Gammaproteobacteria bacterium]|nr:SDR family oxidoreductase [Gammaproteobacteria bacterium]